MGPKLSKEASPTNTFGKLTFYNNSKSDVRVTVASSEGRLIEKSSSSLFGKTVRVKEEGEQKIDDGVTGSESSSEKYDWSFWIAQGERIVKHGTSEEFFAGNDSLQVKYVTVRQGEQHYCVNQMMTACFCFFFNPNDF